MPESQPRRPRPLAPKLLPYRDLRHPAAAAISCMAMGFTWSAVIGFFLGFAFGVGCALAVMYSIYMGGYRAAVRDAQLAEPPERYRGAVERLNKPCSTRSPWLVLGPSRQFRLQGTHLCCQRTHHLQKLRADLVLVGRLCGFDVK